MSAQLVTIPPNTAPGTLYRRITAGDRVLREGPLSLAPVDDAEMAWDEAAQSGETVWCHIYDGDSGECVKTVIVHPASGAN